MIDNQAIAAMSEMLVLIKKYAKNAGADGVSSFLTCIRLASGAAGNSDAICMHTEPKEKL